MIVAREKSGWYGIGDVGGETSRPIRRKRKKAGPVLDRLLLTGLVLIFFLTGLLVTYYYSRLFTLGYQISCLEKELAALKVENHSLEEEVSRLTSLSRIEALAVSRLGMVRPEGGRVLVVTLPENPGSLPDNQVNNQVDGEVQPPAWAGQSKLIEAFDELVNRLEKSNWFGYRTGRAAT